MPHKSFSANWAGLCSGFVLLIATTLGAPACADSWDDVLAGAGLSRDTTRFNQQDFEIAADGAFRTPFFNAIQQDPLSAPFHARVLRSALLANSGSAGDLVMSAASRLGVGTRRTLLGDPLVDQDKQSRIPNALVAAIEAVWASSGRKPSGAESKRLASAVSVVPGDVAQQAAFLLRSEVSALQWRNRAIQPAVDAKLDLRHAFEVFTGVAPTDDADTPNMESLMRSVDLKRMMTGGEDLSIAADRAASALSKRTGNERFSFHAWTPLGWIILNGAGNDTISRVQPNLLIIDTDGDDTYASGGASYSADYPISVLIDRQGYDRYINDPGLAATPVTRWTGRKSAAALPSFGTGVLGYGILIDCAGNDLYRSVGPTQGCAAYGVGVLQDRGGDDVYDSYRQAQGCADFGVGILEDMGGRDAYTCLQNAQGYGGTMGFGLLLDAGGENDTYTAEDAVLDDPSAQTPKHNTSMAQGAGNGRRADFSDGHSLAGGIGVLLDEGGRNAFSAGVFAQGVGYWMGVGMLLTGPGDDAYAGAWYVQGAAAHFAVGLLEDSGGDDSYAATINMAQGAGHDWSVGWLIDDTGNDRYEAPNLSLGSGNAGGFGFFWDKAGNDTYTTQASVALGEAAGGIVPNTIRERNPTVGIFLDGGGKDTYTAPNTGSADSHAWHFVRGDTKPTGGERGSGRDTEAPGLAEPR